MPPSLDWGKLMKVDPDALPNQERIANEMQATISKVKSIDIKDEPNENLIQLFRISQSLMTLKAQEVQLLLEEAEKANEEQLKIENQLRNRVKRLENEIEMAQLSTGSRDSRFLREEIRQLEEQLRQSERELKDMANELEREKQVNEQLALRNEETDNENSKLRRENEQLRQDVIDYQRQIDSQRETLMARSRGQDLKSLLSQKNMELVKYLDEIQGLSEANEKLEVQNQELTKHLEYSVHEMEKMTDEYNKMKLMVQHSDGIMDRLRKEKEQHRLQVQELAEQLKAKNEEDDPVMRAVNAKVDEWKIILASKDDEISDYQKKIIDLREKIKIAQLDADKSSVLALQQALQEKDNQVKMLTEKLEQHTHEMESNTFHIEKLKLQFQTEKGVSGHIESKRAEELVGMLNILDKRVKESERIAKLAESDAREKDKDLVEALRRMREYESGVYGLVEAVAEINELKTQIKIRDQEIESSIKDINKLHLKLNDILDENEELKDRLGLDPKTAIDLTGFKNIKVLKEQQYRAENQVLSKEVESLEEERINLKKQIRKLAQEKGKRAACLGLIADDLNLSVDSPEDQKSKKKKLSSSIALDHSEGMNQHLSKQLSEKEQELERYKTITAELKSKLKEISEDKKHLEQIPKDIFQAIKDVEKDPTRNGEATIISVPSLERLVHAIESRNADGIVDIGVHLKAQVDQLIGRNEELRQELKESRKEGINISCALEKAIEKISHLENELEILRQLEGADIIFKPINLPEGMSPTSTNVLSSLNEYILHLLQEVESKEQSVIKFEEALEEYKRKFAVIRHQHGLLYKEYMSEQESWQEELKKRKEENAKLESQKEMDMVQIKEYTNLLDALKMDPDEMKTLVAENSRKMTVLRVNEKLLTRRYTTLLEMEQHLRKENGKLKNDISDMEAAVAERIGYLQRYKEIAAFKIASIQTALDDSVPLSELETANKQYNELTSKYRDMLQKDNLLVQRTANMEHLEYENASLRSQIAFYSKELEITKEKCNTLEQALEHINSLDGNPVMDKASKAITNNEIVSISKKITMLEMKELNERQRAEHSQKMYEHLRTTLNQIEERNFELETKFAELTKINLEAQKVEQALRDDLANSISKAVSNADRKRILELEKTEAELKVEMSKLRNVSDIAKMQVSALESRQQSREKEVESLRKQILDYQDQSDEKALIAKLHQQIVALQISESIAVGKLEAATAKLHKMEAYNLRLEQKIDDKEQTLYYARMEGRNRAKHLRQTVHCLRRQFSGALPLAQQEKFSKTMMQLQNDKLKTIHEMERVQQERREAENRSVELELKLKGLEDLIGTLKDARGAQKVTEWHRKMEALRLQDLKLSRELSQKKEEIKYLNNIISEQERTISILEEELVQQGKFHEERQMTWDQREVELERQLDMYEHQQNEVLSAAHKFEEATGEVPDSSLPVPEQLEIALRKIKEHVRAVVETKSVCKTLEEKLKEKDALLRTAEHNVLSRDRVINELRLQLPATAAQEKLLSNLNQIKEDSEQHQALKVAHQTVANMQARLNQKEEILKKYQHLLAKAREEQEEVTKKHAEDLKLLHQKLDFYSDTSINKFKEAAKEFMKKPSLQIPSSANVIRFAEMEQTVAEQENSLASLSNKLRAAASELEKQKRITIAKVNEFEICKARFEEKHTVEIKKLKNECEDVRARLVETEKEVNYLNTELEAQKEANTRAPTTTMKNLVERLKNQVALKEKQQQALSKALLTLRAEMTSQAEQHIIAAAAQKEENINVQQIVDKETKDLKARIEKLNEQQLKLKEALKNSKSRENTLMEEAENLNQDLRGKQKALNKLQKDKDEMEHNNEELKKRLKDLANSFQGKADLHNKQNISEELQRRIKKLEAELAKKSEEAERRPARDRDDKSSKEEIVRWEESKKWQIKIEGMRSKLKDKEKEIDSLAKQLTTLKDLYSKGEQEKLILQKKLKSRGVTVDQVVGARTAESEREVEELKKKNQELENEIQHMKTKQALPRDSVIDDLHLKNRFLQEKLQALERQHSQENMSRPSSAAGEEPFLALPFYETQTGKHRSSVFPNKKKNILKCLGESKTILSTPYSIHSEDNVHGLNQSDYRADSVKLEEDINAHKQPENSTCKDHESTLIQSNQLAVMHRQDITYKRTEMLETYKEETQVPDSSLIYIDAPALESNVSVAESREATPKSFDLSVSASEEAASKPSFPISTTATLGLSSAACTASSPATDEQESNSSSGEDASNITSKRLNSAAKTADGRHSPNKEYQSRNEIMTPQGTTELSTLNFNKIKSDSLIGHNLTTDTQLQKSFNEANVSPESQPRSESAEDSAFLKSNITQLESPLRHLQTSGLGSDDQTRELEKENLRLTSENVELQFHLEQANKDLPRLKDQIENFKEMCDLLKKEKIEAERKVASARGSGRSGKTVPELEKTIALMKRVVERVQKENEELKKAPGIVSNEKLTNLEMDNEKLKLEIEKLQLHVGGQLSIRYEAKTKGIEKLIAENDRLRKELKTETETSEKLRIAKRNLEVIKEKLAKDLEEARMSLAERRGPQVEGTHGKAWKSTVLSKMSEAKIKEMESELKKKNESIVDLKKLLKEAAEHEQKTEKIVESLKDENEFLKNFPEEATTEEGLAREFQILRLANMRLQNEKAELEHQLEVFRQKNGVSRHEDYNSLMDSKHDKLMEEVVHLQTNIKTSDLEKQQLREEIKNLKKELQNFDPTFFEEIEDLKYNYNEEVKKNIILEEKLKALSEQFGVHIDFPAVNE